MKKKLSLKKFLSRRLAWGVLLLSNLSLISIGFSAWSISAVTTAEAEINVSAADLIDLNKLFEIQTPRRFRMDPTASLGMRPSFLTDMFIFRS